MTKGGGSSAAGAKASPKRQKELVAVAARLFHDQGYSVTSMQDVADEMGMLKGSVYHYVDTKEDLLWMVVEPQLQDLVEKVRHILSDETIPLPDRLSAAVEVHVQSFELHYPHMFVITQENGETLSPARRTSFTELRVQYLNLWLEAVGAGQETGRIRKDLDVWIVVQGILGMVNWMFRWYAPGGAIDASTVARTFSTIFTEGVLN